MPYIAKGTLYTQYVIKIKFALIHGIELLAFDFIYYPWGESVGDEFVWNSCMRKVKVKAYWTRSCASKVWKRCPFRGETVKNWEGSRVREK